MSDEERLSDERVDELLAAAKADPASVDLALLSALLEVQARRLGDRTPAPPPRPGGSFSEQTLQWMRDCLENDVQMLYDDPHGVAYEKGESPEIKVLESWEELVAVATELKADFLEIVNRVATDYERERMDKILGSGRWARDQVAGEEQEAL